MWAWSRFGSLVAGGFSVVRVVAWGAVSFLGACQKTCVIGRILHPRFLGFPNLCSVRGLFSTRYVLYPHGPLCGLGSS